MISDVAKLDCTVGDVSLVVKSGDITKERCDAIVNSTTEDFDLRRGKCIVFPLLLVKLYIIERCFREVHSGLPCVSVRGQCSFKFVVIH